MRPRPGLRPLLTAALLAALGAFPTHAQPAYEVADLASESQFHSSSYFVHPEALVVGDLLYFQEDDGAHGRELWRSDGTALGTYLVRDLCKGSCGSRTGWWGHMAELGGTLLFVANDGVHGLELWRSDGTALGTTLVADLEPGYRSSQPRFLTSAAGQVFFLAQSEALGAGLWRTDGTAQGTYMISPNPPGQSFNPSSLHASASLLYLCDVTSPLGTGLWRSDGTLAGTQFVAPIACVPSPIGKMSSRTILADGDLLFSGDNGSSGAELWRSDGTLAGTLQVADLVPGVGSSYPSSLARVGGDVVFRTSTGPLGSELWRTDGTFAGTVPIALADGARPMNDLGTWAVVENRYYFAAQDDLHGGEPWFLDGLSAQRVIDLLPGPDSSLATGFAAYGQRFFAESLGELIFSADEGLSGLELWRSNGSEAGTTRISDIAPGTTPFLVPFFWSLLPQPTLADRLLTIEFQPATGYRLWRLNAAGDAMDLLHTIDAQESALEPIGRDRASIIEPAIGRFCFAALGTKLFFELGADRDALFGSPRRSDLWRSDGSGIGTVPRLEGWTYAWAGDCQPVNNRLLFPAGANDSRVLLAVGPENGEETLAPLSPDTQTVDTYFSFAGQSYFSIGSNLWRSDGTVPGTSPIASGIDSWAARMDDWTGEILAAGSNLWLTSESAPGGALSLTSFDSSSGDYVLDVAGLASNIVFAGFEGAHGAELWVSDGTEASATLLMDIRPGPGDSFSRVSIDTYASYRERLFGAADLYAVFAADDSAHGSELWITDGTALGTGLLRDIFPGDYPSTPRQFTRLGNRIVFSAEDEEHGLELWVTDGTYDGTALLKDVAPGTASSVPDDLVVQDGFLYYSAWSPNYGREAWRSDGTPAGTIRITDVAPGPKSSSPQRFARAGNRLYFSATDQIRGYELWAISDDGTIPLFLDGFENESTNRWTEVQP